MSINYVVVSWAGRRRVNPSEYVKDPACLLRMHLASLKTLPHSLSQVTVVVNRCPDEHPSYRYFIRSLPKELGKTRLEVLERDNVGYSYGAYADVFERYRSIFRLYFLMEDDYRFTCPNFDTIMADALDREGAGFATFMLRKGTRDWISGRARKESPRGDEVAQTLERTCPPSFTYPQVCLGLARSRSLEEVRKVFGRLPHSTGVSHPENKFEGQFALVTAIQKVGWKLFDMTSAYRAREHGPSGAISELGPEKSPLLVEPLQPLLSASDKSNPGTVPL